jgi:hypothetical protein
MKAKTFMYTDWTEVHNGNSAYMAKVFLTGKDEAYMIMIKNGKKRFFKVDANLLKLGELGFFEKVMESADELPIQLADDLGLKKLPF